MTGKKNSTASIQLLRVKNKRDVWACWKSEYSYDRGSPNDVVAKHKVYRHGRCYCDMKPLWRYRDRTV